MATLNPQPASLLPGLWELGCAWVYLGWGCWEGVRCSALQAVLYNGSGMEHYRN